MSPPEQWFSTCGLQQQQHLGNASSQAPYQPYLVRNSEAGVQQSLHYKPSRWFWTLKITALDESGIELRVRWGSSNTDPKFPSDFTIEQTGRASLEAGLVPLQVDRESHSTQAGSCLWKILVCLGLQLGPVGKVKSDYPSGIFTRALH